MLKLPWKDFVPDMRVLTKEELKMFPDKYKYDLYAQFVLLQHVTMPVVILQPTQDFLLGFTALAFDFSESLKPYGSRKHLYKLKCSLYFERSRNQR